MPNFDPNLKAFLLFIFVLFLCFSFSKEAEADWGTKMIAVKCDGTHGEVVFQPFVQWNDNYLYQGLKLEPQKDKKLQFIENYTFFFPKTFENKILKIHCKNRSRNIEIFLDGQVATIVDIKGEKSWAREIDLSTDTGYAWKIFGPLYKIQSNQFGLWQECRARGDVAVADTKYICVPFGDIEK